MTNKLYSIKYLYYSHDKMCECVLFKYCFPFILTERISTRKKEEKEIVKNVDTTEKISKTLTENLFIEICIFKNSIMSNI